MPFENSCPGLFQSHLAKQKSQLSIKAPTTSTTPTTATTPTILSTPPTPANPTYFYQPGSHVPEYVTYATLAPYFANLSFCGASVPKTPEYWKDKRRKFFQRYGLEPLSEFQFPEVWHSDDTRPPSPFPGIAPENSLVWERVQIQEIVYYFEGVPRPDNPMIFFQNVFPVSVQPSARKVPLEVKLADCPEGGEYGGEYKPYYAYRLDWYRSIDNAQRSVRLIELGANYGEQICLWYFRMIFFTKGYRYFGMPYDNKSPLLPDDFPQADVDLIAKDGLMDFVIRCADVRSLVSQLGWTNAKTPDEALIDQIIVLLGWLTLFLTRFRAFNCKMTFKGCEEMTMLMATLLHSQSYVNAPFEIISQLEGIEDFCKMLVDFKPLDDWKGSFEQLIKLHTQLTVEQIASGVTYPVPDKPKTFRDNTEI